MDSSELIEEVIEEEILPRVVPVKSLFKMRRVSKPWCSLIDNKPFIGKHLRNSATRGITAVFNHRNTDTFEPRFSPSREYPPVDRHLPLSLYNFYVPSPAPWYVVGHHNGLLCILVVLDLEACFLLSNPATRAFVQLPYPGVIAKENKFGFRWDEHSGAYKVFIGAPDLRDGGRIARIYSSDANSWRTMDHGSASLIGDFGVFARGKIYWLTTSGHIEYLDLRNEVFGKTVVDPPRELKFGDDVRVWLWESRGSRLCVVCDTKDRTKRSVWVWVMKEEENNTNTNWVEDEEGVASELNGMEVNGVYGAFPYFETLVSPPPHLPLVPDLQYYDDDI